MRLRTGGASVFVPPQRQNLQFWADAKIGVYTDAAMTIPAAADADPVGGWTDLSGKGNHATQATGGLRPVLKLSQLNGKPSVLFTAASAQYLAANGAAAAFAGTNIPVTLIVVIRYVTNTGQFGFCLASSVSANPRGEFNQSSGPANQLVLRDDTATNRLAIAGTNPGTVPHILSFTFDGTNGQIFQDGTSVAGPTVAGSGTYTYNNFTVGGLVSTTPVAGVYLNAHVMEILMWNVGLTSSDRSSVQGYLSRKYGLAIS